MVNWVWNPLFSENGISDNAVLKLKWEDFKTSKQAHWLAEDVYDAKPLKEYWRVSEASFVSYQSKEMGRKGNDIIIPYINMNLSNQVGAHHATYCSFMDSLYGEYTKIFQHMIANKKLSAYGELFER